MLDPVLLESFLAVTQARNFSEAGGHDKGRRQAAGVVAGGPVGEPRQRPSPAENAGLHRFPARWAEVAVERVVMRATDGADQVARSPAIGQVFVRSTAPVAAVAVHFA